MELRERPSSRATGQTPEEPRSAFGQDHVRHRFNDLVTGSTWLNRFLIRSNMFCGHLYCNVINAPLMSAKSHKIKAALQHEQDESFSVEEAATCGRKWGQQSGPKLSSIWSFWRYRSSRSGGPLAQQPRRRQQQEVDRQAAPLKLRLPKRNSSILMFVLLLELVVILEFAYITYYLSDTYPKVQLLTCTRPEGSIKYEVIKFERYINLTDWESLARGNVAIGRRDQEGACLERMELEVNEQFGEFYLWEASIGFNQRNTSGRLFNDEINRPKYLTDEFFIHQLIRKEIRLYNYLIAFFLLSCLAGSLIADRVPYDITPLVLIYDPQFVANTIHLRLNHYLELMRNSYINYWSIYSLDETTNELMIDGGDTSNGAINCSSKIVDTRSLNYTQQFSKNYLPTVRSQAWRKVLIFWHPILIYASMFVALGSIVSIWQIFLRLNTNGAQTNAQLYRFLLNKKPPSESNNNSKLAQLEAQCGDELEMDLIRKAIAHNYAQSLRQHNEQLYQLKRMNYLNSTFPELNNNNYNLDEADLELQIVANTLGPIEGAPVTYWILPSFTVQLPCLLASLYLVILIITFWDLCIWIVELRLKLNICSAILNHYQNFNINAHQQQIILNSSNNRATRNSLDRITITLSEITSKPTELNFFNFDQQQQQQQQQHNYCSLRQKRPDGYIAMLLQRFYRLSYPDIRLKPKLKQSKHLNSNSMCNIDLSLLIVFLVANGRDRQLIIESYARELINLDLIDFVTQRKASEKFLTSTYLDFRLFLDQVEDCRSSINFLIGYTVTHSLNIIAASASLSGIWVQFGFLLFGFFLANLGFLCGGFFQSQCSKLYAPIHLLIASCTYGDKVVNHLASLWRRSLIDLCGLRSKLSFRVYSLNISYALALKVSFPDQHRLA